MFCIVVKEERDKMRKCVKIKRASEPVKHKLYLLLIIIIFDFVSIADESN